MGSQLSVIRGNVRNNLGEATAEFYTNGELNQYIGTAYKQYFLLMISEGEGYFETTTNIDVVANQAAYSVSSLSPPFYSVSAIERYLPNGTWPCREDERRFTPNYTLGINTGYGWLPSYRMRGMNLIFEPTPQFNETNALKLEYVYAPTFPSSGSADSFTFDDNFSVVHEPLIELYATIAALEAKDGMGGVSDIASFRNRLAELQVVFMDGLNRYEYPDKVTYAGINYSPFNQWYY